MRERIFTARELAIRLRLKRNKWHRDNRDVLNYKRKIRQMQIKEAA